MKKPVLEKVAAATVIESTSTDTSKENFNNKENTETGDKTANINLAAETIPIDLKIQFKPIINKAENTQIETKPKKPELSQSDMDKAIKTLSPSGIKFNDNDSVLDLEQMKWQCKRPKNDRTFRKNFTRC